MHLVLTVFLVAHKLRLEERGQKQNVSKVRTVEFKEMLLMTCSEICDEWSETVEARIPCLHDLRAADAFYHKSCSVNFGTKSNIPASWRLCLLELKFNPK